MRPKLDKFSFQSFYDGHSINEWRACTFECLLQAVTLKLEPLFASTQRDSNLVSQKFKISDKWTMNMSKLIAIAFILRINQGENRSIDAQIDQVFCCQFIRLTSGCKWIRKHQWLWKSMKLNLVPLILRCPLVAQSYLWSKNGHFCQKCPSLRPGKWHFEWPNQNSKTIFIVQTFPKYGLYDFYLVSLSLLGAILAIFQFCGFSGLFWPFFPCNCNV